MTHYGHLPTATGTTGTRGCPMPSLPSTLPPRRWVASRPPDRPGPAPVTPRLASRRRTTGGLRDSDKGLRAGGVGAASRDAAEAQGGAGSGPGWVNTTFQVGDQVMLRIKEVLDAAEVGTLRPRWEDPFTMASLACPNTCTLTLPPSGTPPRLQVQSHGQR